MAKNLSKRSAESAGSSRAQSESSGSESQDERWQEVIVSESEENERLDAFLVRHFSGHSRVKLQRAIANGNVLVDGNRMKSSTRIQADQTIRFLPPTPQPEGSIAENIPLDVLYEDEFVVAINKPPAMVVHPAKGHWSGTLTAALAYRFSQLSQIGGPTRPGIVHRLDRDTSGVILVAKTDQAHLSLSSQFEQRTVEKEYVTLVSPAPDRDRDMIEKPIGAHPYQREKKAIREGHPTSRAASTFYEVVERFRGFALVRVKPKTGRTHQIRVHMAHIGTPVLCDRLYGGRARLLMKDLSRKESDRDVLLDRQALHARSIKFHHPRSGELIEIQADIPKDMEQTLKAIQTFRS